MQLGTGLALWWIKRDARLTDNAALAHACAQHPTVLPCAVWEPSWEHAADTSRMHRHAWWQAVLHVRKALRKRGADAYLAIGETVDVLAELHRRQPFTAIYAHEEIGDARSFARDRAVTAWCRERGIVYREFPQCSVRRGGVNRDRFQELWQSRIAETTPIPTIEHVPMDDELRTFATQSDWPPVAGEADWQPVTERDAILTLESFLEHRGLHYSGGISSPNTAFEAGSRLSVHFAWGTLSIRQAFHATAGRLCDISTDRNAVQWRRSLNNFLARLHWRDHFIQRLESEPELESQAIHPSYRTLEYANDPRFLTCWAEGRTGYPLVDAVMRCLAATGFANFRMRAMSVSFACHCLHLDWRVIHPHLGGVFRDYEPGIHFSQLQMQAGVVGWNTIRVYSPVKQLNEQDPAGMFVRRWLPELRGLPFVQLASDASGSADYPPPIVQWGEQARIMTDRLYAIRNDPAARALTPAVYRKHGSRRPPTTRRTRPRHVTLPTEPSLFDPIESDAD